MHFVLLVHGAVCRQPEVKPPVPGTARHRCTTAAALLLGKRVAVRTAGLEPDGEMGEMEATRATKGAALDAISLHLSRSRIIAFEVGEAWGPPLAGCPPGG